jgi:hypothetical protein
LSLSALISQPGLTYIHEPAQLLLALTLGLGLVGVRGSTGGCRENYNESYSRREHPQVWSVIYLPLHLLHLPWSPTYTVGTAWAVRRSGDRVLPMSPSLPLFCPPRAKGEGRWRRVWMGKKERGAQDVAGCLKKNPRFVLALLGG